MPSNTSPLVKKSNSTTGSTCADAAARISAESGTTLNLTGNLTGTNVATTFAGAGDINVARITTGTGTVEVASSGTVTFNGSGTTTVTTASLPKVIVNAGALSMPASVSVTTSEAQRGFDTTAHQAEDVALLADTLSARLGARRVSP